MLGVYGPPRYQSDLRSSCAGYCRVDGIQAASGSLRISEDEEPMCEVCDRGTGEYLCCAPGCGKWLCVSCSRVYRRGEVFCAACDVDAKESTEVAA